MFSSLNIFFLKKDEGSILWWSYIFLFLRVMNEKVELGHGLKS